MYKLKEMKNLKRKINCALTLSAMSLIIVIAIIGLWMFKSQEISVVTLDTFIGVIVGLLAIIVTVAIGWQIFNIYEVKSQLAKIQQLNIKLEEQREAFEEMSMSSNHLHAIALSYISITQKKYGEAFRYLLEALYLSLQLPSMPNLESILLTIEEDCVNNIKSGDIVKSEFYDRTILMDKKLRKLQVFDCIKRRYEKIYNDYMKKVCVDDEQK